MFGISQPVGMGFIPPETRSFPVYAATTDLRFFAGSRLMRTMRACACGLRTNAA